MTRRAPTVRQILKRHRAELAARLGLVPRAVPVEGGDLADESVQLSDRLYHFASREQLVLQLQEFDAALEREAEGMYGVCIDCSGLIPAARLKALPAAARDARCQAAHENERAREIAREHEEEDDLHC